MDNCHQIYRKCRVSFNFIKCSGLRGKAILVIKRAGDDERVVEDQLPQLQQTSSPSLYKGSIYFLQPSSF